MRLLTCFNLDKTCFFRYVHNKIHGRWHLALASFTLLTVLLIYVNVETVDRFPAISAPHYKGQKKHFINSKNHLYE